MKGLAICTPHWQPLRYASCHLPLIPIAPASCRSLLVPALLTRVQKEEQHDMALAAHWLCAIAVHLDAVEQTLQSTLPDPCIHTVLRHCTDEVEELLRGHAQNTATSLSQLLACSEVARSL